MRTDPPRALGIPDYGRDVHCLLGLPVDAVDLRGALQHIRGAAEQGSRCFLSTPNVNFVVASRADAAFRQSVAHSDLSVADGMPLVWLAKMLAVPLPERVAGASLFEALDQGHGARPLSVYFFGGGEGAAAAAAARLGRGSNLVCVGFQSPGFGSVEEMSRPDFLGRINAAHPDVLVVALGARKGQAWIERNRHRLRVPVISHLGAVVDFAAGEVRRAPRWMQRSGLEWLWRIRERPALWRRYVGDAAALALLVVFRVVPCALQRRWHRRRRRPARRSVQVTANSRAYHIRLEGAWTGADATPLRRYFAEASASGKDVRLDLGAVTYLDSAVLGLLILLAGHQRAHGRRLRFAPLPSRVRRMFDFSCAEYLYRDVASHRLLEEDVLSDERG